VRGGWTLRRVLAGLIGIALAFGLLLWSLRGVRIDEVVHNIRAARPVPLIVAILIATITYPLRLPRWRLLLRDDRGGPLPVAPLWHAIAIGFLANGILPFRAGELVRTYAATRLAGIRFTSALSSIAVERIFDGLTVVALLAFALLRSDLPPGITVGGASLLHVAQITGLMMLGALVIATLVVVFPLAAEGVVRRVLPAGKFADAIVRAIEGIRQGMASLRSPALVLGVAFWSLVLWSVNALALYVCFAAFNIPVGYNGALLLQGILVFGISVQVTPGYLGQFEAAIVAALALYGVPNGVASSYAIVYHGTTFLPVMLLGAWSLARTPVALRDLQQPQA
jgi:glycosyltransferase 2 family protein